MRNTLKMLGLAAALGAALALGGCAQLSSPQATQAAANVRAFTMGFACFVGNVSGLAVGVEAALRAQVNVGNAMVDRDTGLVYVISAGICESLGGVMPSRGLVAVPATATRSLP